MTKHDEWKLESPPEPPTCIECGAWVTTIDEEECDRCLHDIEEEDNDALEELDIE